MNWNLFEKIINDCLEFGVKKIYLTNFGESLLDSRLFKRIKYIKDRAETVKVAFITNGFLLNNENI
ncbi:MAG: hypothetical protein NC925_05540 [Candidatus Omnitrophica bacterium]|nr:hypothetical protein [Candidatus Omnitrophota bacterium]